MNERERTEREEQQICLAYSLEKKCGYSIMIIKIEKDINIINKKTASLAKRNICNYNNMISLLFIISFLLSSVYVSFGKHEDGIFKIKIQMTPPSI